MADPITAGGAGTPGEPKQGEGQASVFTQEQVNAIAAKARAEERQKYQDYDTLKEAKTKLDKLEAAKLTETERLQRELADTQRKVIDAEGRIASAMIATEVKVKAMAKGIVDPDAALKLLDRTGVAYSEETGVSGVDGALDRLVEAKPYLKAVVVGGKTPNINAAGGKPAPFTGLTPEQRETAKFMGLSEEQYARGLAAKP